MEKRQALVQIKDLRQYFDIGSGKTVHSLNGINLDIYAGEALGIVGESGCGKSTIAGILAAKILATSDEELLGKLKAYSENLKEDVEKKAEKLEKIGYKEYMAQK